ncbi:MAG: hypothetical protein H7Y60_05915, partial [Rhodospirillaceae bacterium]|nr:hypothetical protein [Rhodospirillales bacterium]
MLRPTLVAVLIVAAAMPVLAQQPINLLPPREQIQLQPPVSAADKPLLDEPAPNFQPIRPAEAEDVPPKAPVETVPVPAAPPAPPAPT